MSKTKLKISLIPLTSFCAYESWLSDMSKRGLILRKAGSIFTRFTVSEPKNLEYRIQFIGNPISEETKEQYKKAGWTYVNTRSEYSFFYHETEPASSPINEDILRQGMNFNYVTRNFTMIYASLVVLILTLLWFLYINILSSPFPLLNAAASFLSLLLLLSGAAVMIACSLKYTREFRKLRQLYLEGKKLNHHMPWRKYRKSAATVILILTALLLINIGADLYSHGHTFRYYNEQPPKALLEEEPLLRLSEIESKGQSADQSGEYEIFFFLKKPSLLYTEYVLSEAHPVETKPQASKDTAESSFMEEIYLELGPAFLAKPILKDFADNTLYNYKHGSEREKDVKLIELHDKRFDEAYYIYRDNSIDLFIRKNNVVIKLHYLGSKKIDDIIPLLLK